MQIRVSSFEIMATDQLFGARRDFHLRRKIIRFPPMACLPLRLPTHCPQCGSTQVHIPVI
jgi:hypothetical protein